MNQINITVAPIDVPLDPIKLFSPIANLPWAMLLDSAVADDGEHHPDARFDIIVADPLATLVTTGRQTAISHGDVTTLSGDDPLAIVKHWQQKLVAELTSEQSSKSDCIDALSLPFSGGAIGHFSYDLGRRFEQLPQLASDDIELPEMAVGIYDWALILDHQQGTALLVVNATNNENKADAWQQRLAWLQQKWQQDSPAPIPFQLKSDWHHQIDRDRYQQQFEQVQRYLHSGDCYQINLTQRFQAGYQGCEWQAYQRLRQGNLAPFSAFIRLPDCALLSVSPERFLQLDGDNIQTKPIKGTRPRSQDNNRDAELRQQLQQSPKDQAENVMIVDLLRNDIGRVAAAGSVRVPQLFAVESFPAVHHLVSTVTAKLAPQFHATDLLRACFPGGSITGAPKIRAMEIIEELEPQRRSLYCGSIGYISNNGKIDSSITIRSLVAKRQQIYCWAGGGIVVDSKCDSEYQEIFDKLSRILPRLTE